MTCDLMRRLKTFFTAGLFLFSCLLIVPANVSGQQQNELDVLKNYWLIHSNAQNYLNDHLAAEAFRLLDKRNEEIRSLKSDADWQSRQEKVRDILWKIMGPFPEKTPLNARITSTVKKKDYKVENIIYESLPGFYVTASLFIPEKVKRPAPAILFCCGHTSGVYRLDFYQLPVLNLVKKGFIVLAIDPVGQGERLQYFDPAKGESVIGSSTKEHSYPAPQLFLTGRSVARYFAWDGIRGIDYLVSRKEVDPKRIGVHGLSGGGTQTAYISALDKRVAASAPAGYITSYRRLIESVGVQDGEQNLYNELSEGIDHADFIEVRAPRPTLIMATTRDFFSIQGTRETMKELKQAYAAPGKPENIEITEDDNGHGYTKKNREAMYAFFQKHLQLPGSPLEEELEFSSAQELQKTPTGQLSTSLGGETVFSLNKADANILIKNLEDSRKKPGYPENSVEKAKQLSGFIQPMETPEPVFTGRIQRDGYVIEKYFIEGEGKYVIPYLMLIPEKPSGKTIIYLDPAGKSAEATKGGEAEWLAMNGFTVLAPDLLGTGEMAGSYAGDAMISNVSYNVWFTSVITGRSITGIRAGDIIRLRMVLEKRSATNEIFAIGRKELADALLFASSFDEEIKRIALIEPYSSYRSLVLSRFYYPGFVPGIVAGALTAFDLPDLAASLAPRKLLISGMTDANRERMNKDEIERDISVIRKVYREKNCVDQLMISGDPSVPKDRILLEWLK